MEIIDLNTLQLQKDQKVYCFIGDNRVGKTKLLRALHRKSFEENSNNTTVVSLGVNAPALIMDRYSFIFDCIKQKYKCDKSIEVYIDDIELHLHPRKQLTIIKDLKKTFPDATFYITTNSPLIVFTLQNGEVYKLIKDKNNEVTVDKILQTNMHFIADILEDFFDTDVGSRHIDKESMLKGRSELLKLLDETPE